MKRYRKPTLKQMLKMAETFWKGYGRFTLFPSRMSYLAYIRDLYKQIKKMSSEQYAKYVILNSQTHVEQLKRLEKALIEKRQELQNTSPK